MVYTINGEQLTRRKLVTIDGSQVTTQTGIPLMLNIDLQNVATDGKDVRLTKLDGTPIAREIECVDVPNTDSVTIHYLFDTVASTDSQFYVYWGNANLSEPAADSAYGSESVWVSAYKGVWHLSEDPNGDASNSILDSTLNDNHGTPAGSMTTADLVDSDYGKALDFDGSNDEISVGYTNVPTGTAARTSMVRFKFDGAGNDAIFGYGGDTNYTGFAVLTLNDTTLQLDNWGNAGNVTVSSLGSSIYHTLHTIFNGTDTLFYVDGVYINTVLESSVPINTGTARGSHIAVRRHADGNYYNYNGGYIDEVQHCAGVFSANYISTTHKNLNNPTASGSDPFYKLVSTSQHQRRTPQFIN